MGSFQTTWTHFAQRLILGLGQHGQMAQAPQPTKQRDFGEDMSHRENVKHKCRQYAQTMTSRSVSSMPLKGDLQPRSALGGVVVTPFMPHSSFESIASSQSGCSLKSSSMYDA